jgi:hypothetical protein
MSRSPKRPCSYLLAQDGVIEVAPNEEEEVVVVVPCAFPSRAGVGVSVLVVRILFSESFRKAGRGFRPVAALDALMGVNILLALNVDDAGHC